MAASPTSDEPHGTPWPAVVATFAGPAMLGVVVGTVGESSLLGALVLLAEPLLVGIGLYGLLALLWGRRWAAAVALLAGLVVGGAALHLPAHPTPLAAAEPGWATDLRDCAEDREPLHSAVRLLTWRISPDEDVPNTEILATQPDLVVVHGVARASQLDTLNEVMGGEAIFMHDPHGGVGIVVRGIFRYCGGETDRWEMTLADGLPGQTPDSTSEARLSVTLPDVDGAGSFALVTAVLPPPGEGKEPLAWPSRLIGGAQQVASVIAALGSDRVVLVSDLQSPRSFSHVSGALLGAGLVEAPSPPTWPNRLGPFPALPLHAFDRVWHGSSWAVERAQTAPGGRQPRVPLIVELGPSTAAAQRGH